MLKRKLAIFMALSLAATAIPVTGVQTVNAQDGVNHLIINQVYGGGGKGKTPIANSFIELYNPTDQAISLEDYSIVVDNDSDNKIENTINFTAEAKIGVG